MTQDRKKVEVATRRKFILDEIHISKSPLGSHFIITVFLWKIGDGVPSGIDKSKSYTYKATVCDDTILIVPE